MKGVGSCSSDVAGLDLTVTPPPPPPPPQTPTTGLSIDEAEPAEAKIQRLISEHPVIIFTKSSSSCCMCHVMRKLLSSVGVHPTVIELDDSEIVSLSSTVSNAHAPSLFIGGACVGGLESLVALHLSGDLVPRLVEVGALRGYNSNFA